VRYLTQVNSLAQSIKKLDLEQSIYGQGLFCRLGWACEAQHVRPKIKGKPSGWGL